jgi:uncharacterized protein
MNIKHCMIGLAAGAATALALAQGVPVLSHPLPSQSTAPAKPAAKAASAAAAYREITWDELVPKDWDPTKAFKDINLATLSDADPRAAAAMKRMREAWDNAPANNAIDDAQVKIPGYIVPLEDGKTGMKEFLLVPYFGACIHTPPPPSNQIIHVKPQPAPKGFRSMDTVWVSGKLKTLRSDTTMGASSYRMEATLVEPYVEPGEKKKP